MRLSIHPDSQSFLAAAGPMLYARETVNNLILGVSERLVRNPTAYHNPFFATVGGKGTDIRLAAVMTPPLNLVLAGNAGAEVGFACLIEYLYSQPIHVPGVIGPAEVAASFSQAWAQLTGDRVEISMRQRIYELRQVQMPELPPGAFRMASVDMIPTIAHWLQAFEAEALGEEHEINEPRAERLINGGQIFTWVVVGQAVSMAMKIWPIAHSITISGVYTPPEHRRQGYASALVAMLSQHLLDEGYWFVNLFTDLDNPTSNKIYQEVGYRPVCDFRVYRFTNMSN